MLMYGNIHKNIFSVSIPFVGSMQKWKMMERHPFGGDRPIVSVNENGAPKLPPLSK